MGVKKLVAHLVKKHQTDDPFVIAENKGITILYQDLGSTLGYFITYKRIPIININSGLDYDMQRIVCAHELGHAILHPKLNTPFMKKHTLFSIDKVEREANRFAAELLISDESIMNCASETINYIASIHNVPLELVKLKCEKLFL